MPTLSVLSPAYREEAVLPFFQRELAKALAPLEKTYQIEIIYVDDGSDDGTLSVLQTLAAQDKRVQFLSLSRNFGKEAALLAGLEHARGDAVIILDSDLQHPPSLIPLLVQRWQEGHDLVLTIKADDKRLSMSKRWSSRLFYGLMGWLSDTRSLFAPAKPGDQVAGAEKAGASCDFSLISRRVVESILQMREQHRFLRGLVRWVGYPSVAVPFQPDLRPAGQTKFHLRQLVSLAADSLFSFSRVPLRLPLYLGLPIVALSLLFSLGLAIYQLTGGESAGWAYVFSALHFLGGCLLCALGVLGEYIGRIYEQVKQRPLYLLKARSPGLAQPEAGTYRRDAA